MPADGRHSRVRVPTAQARPSDGVTRGRWRTAHHRGRRPGRHRRGWLLAATGVLAGALALVAVPRSAPEPDTSPPGPSASTAGTPYGPSGAWRLVFADELDPTRWLPCVSHGQLGYPTRCTGWKEELQTYRRDNVVVRDGALRLVGTRGPGGYTSGAITTARDTFGFDQPGYTEFTHTYGYTEVRFRAPAGPGTWPAVWALPYNGEGDEIDVVEVVKGDAYFTLHTGGEGGGDFALTGTDFTRGWHVVGTEWEPGRLTWYVDGRSVYTVTAGVPDQPFFVQANLALGGSWPGPPTGDTPFPVSFDIDYIRVYQR